MKKNKAPVRYTGQHFTVDKLLIADAIRIADIREDDVVLDIGAGKGFLTVHLARLSKYVIAIEKDKGLVGFLHRRFAHDRRVHTIGIDFLKYSIQQTSFKVVSNIPYNITSEILKILMFNHLAHLECASLIMQYEPASKLIRATGSDPYKLFYRSFFEFAILYEVPPESFMPPPKVRSALVKITKKRGGNLNPEMKDRYFSYLCFMLKEPDMKIHSALKKMFRKRQSRAVIEKLNLQSRTSVSGLTADQHVYCFNQMLLSVPQRYHPMR
ncbi:ribosomal RNA small subunit methyltransferase A [Parapedobacter soli]|uniref:ribosomal RNA small subunit methyltransferase A n=1 Tax=Parapedobacter soli TaxID=416955 RepID=UPI0021C6379E|nr:rRNA adenine N(6)-methyltransferase family protein [Parapedobacter soli]